mmetsp:Transcript_26288/g.61600  ORF Transcript_26288/g.61600 Transcript_26288/m.61600 type:complete len:281 (+) Transcript_26288:222-1064(+)
MATQGADAIAQQGEDSIPHFMHYLCCFKTTSHPSNNKSDDGLETLPSFHRHPIHHRNQRTSRYLFRLWCTPIIISWPSTNPRDGTPCPTFQRNGGCGTNKRPTPETVVATATATATATAKSPPMLGLLPRTASIASVCSPTCRAGAWEAGANEISCCRSIGSISPARVYYSLERRARPHRESRRCGRGRNPSGTKSKRERQRLTQTQTQTAPSWCLGVSQKSTCASSRPRDSLLWKKHRYQCRPKAKATWTAQMRTPRKPRVPLLLPMELCVRRGIDWTG